MKFINPERKSSPKLKGGNMPSPVWDLVLDRCWWHWPIRGDEVHAEHDALLRVLSTIGGDHHHVAGYLRIGAFQTHGLKDKVGREKAWRKERNEELARGRGAETVFWLHQHRNISTCPHESGACQIIGTHFDYLFFNHQSFIKVEY